MHTERLSILRDALRAHADDIKHHFDLLEWVGKKGCDTFYCACGFAATLTKLQAQGFGLDNYVVVFHTPDYIWRGWSAVRHFFELNPDQAHWLFAEFSYASGAGPLEVADRIDALLNGVVAPVCTCYMCERSGKQDE
jgi:hypothetical protein